MKYVEYTNVLWSVVIFATYSGAISSGSINVTNSVISNGFDFVCPNEQIVYWCTTRSTVLDWTVVAGQDNALIQFDTAINTPGEGRRRPLAGSFVYSQLLEIQTDSNGTVMSSVLNFAVSPNTPNGTVRCSTLTETVPVEFAVAGTPGSLQGVTVDLLKENIEFCSYTYGVLWRAPDNVDLVDLDGYFVEIDNSLISGVMHRNLSEYSLNVTLCPGIHTVTVYGRDHCNQITLRASLDVSVPQPTITRTIGGLIGVGAFFWLLLCVLVIWRSSVLLFKKTLKEPRVRAHYLVSGFMSISSTFFLVLSLCLFIGLGVTLHRYDGRDCTTSCMPFIVTREVLLALAIAFGFFAMLIEWMGVTLLVWMHARTKPTTGIQDVNNQDEHTLKSLGQ